MKTLTLAIRAPFLKKFLGQPVATTAVVDSRWDNDYAQKGSKATSGEGPQYEVEMLRVDSDNKLRLGGAAVNPSRTVLAFPLATSASLLDQVFFIAPFACRVEKIEAVHATANGAAMTGVIKKMADGVALASGTSLHSGSGSFDLDATANTLQAATLSNTEGVVDLAAGDRLGIDFTGTLTSLAGLVVQVTLSPGGKGNIAVFALNANGDLADQAFFIANRPMKIAAIKYAHTVLGTNASAVNIQVTKDVSTDAPGAGTDLLTNNTDAGFNGKGTINTVQAGALSATAANLRLAVGDRLSLDFAGTLTALAGVVVVVLFEPTYDRVEVTYNLAKNANLVDQAFFIADRDYEVIAASAVWSVVSSGATNVQLTADKAAEAPGAGTDLLSNDSSAGFQTDGTANTVEAGIFLATLARPAPVLLAGDRLSVDYSGTLTGLVGVVATVSLKPV